IFKIKIVPQKKQNPDAHYINLADDIRNQGLGINPEESITKCLLNYKPKTAISAVLCERKSRTKPSLHPSRIQNTGKKHQPNSQ
ncbi:hypothetical protein ACSTLK_23165, partial [Vibrio parahaemolyticus]